MPTPVHPYSEYGVALRTLRSARSWLGYGLFLCIAAQIVGFFLMWATTQPYIGMKAKYEQPPQQKTGYDLLREMIQPFAPAASRPATRPDLRPAPEIDETVFFPGTHQGRKLNIHKQWEATYSTAVPVTQILSLMAVCSQVIVMFLTLLLILVAQAPGVVHVTRGLIWSILLLFMVFPWQYIAPSLIPGALYRYQELLEWIGPHVVHDPKQAVPGVFFKLLIYARFIVWPIISMVVLLIVSEKFRAGIMLAIGHPLQSMLQPRTPPAVGSVPVLPTGASPRK